MSDLDPSDPNLWNTIYHGSASEIEMTALALAAELRRERERVATLEGAMRDHDDCRVCLGLLDD